MPSFLEQRRNLLLLLHSLKAKKTTIVWCKAHKIQHAIKTLYLDTLFISLKKKPWERGLQKIDSE